MRSDIIVAVKRLEVRLSETDMNTLKSKANIAGISISAFIRKAINDTEIKQGPTLELAMLIKELNRIGNNINQIAVKANALGFIDTPKLTYELDKLDSIERLIVEAFAMEK